MNRNRRALNADKPVDELYASGSFVIRWLLGRLLDKTAALLASIDSLNSAGLDVGCGEGHLIDYLKRRHVIGSVLAIDLKRQKLETAKQMYPQVDYFNADVNALSFKDNMFDYVVASEIIEHIPEPARALRELQRVAKKQAYFIVSVPHEPFFRWGNVLRGKYWGRGGRTPSHVNFWTRSEFKQFLGEFVDIRQAYTLAVFPWSLYLGVFKPAGEDRRSLKR
jgi:ubiquinone/menaquinone biosynthesis C-methylase UbiE